MLGDGETEAEKVSGSRLQGALSNTPSSPDLVPPKLLHRDGPRKGWGWGRREEMLGIECGRAPGMMRSPTHGLQAWEEDR